MTTDFRWLWNFTCIPMVEGETLVPDQVGIRVIAREPSISHILLGLQDQGLIFPAMPELHPRAGG
jgi:hypothetical protein